MPQLLRQFISFFLIFILYQNLFAYPGKIIKAIAAPGKYCTGLTYSADFLWIADYQADTIYKIDPFSGVVLHRIPSPGFWPMGLAWDGNYLWNADLKQKKIYQIDANNGTVLSTIESPSNYPEALAWDGHSLWLADGQENEIMKIDLNDGTVVKKFNGPARSVNGLSFDGKYLWCSDRLMNEIYMIDPESGEVIIIIDAPGPYIRGLACDGTFIWTVDFQNDSIYQIVRCDEEKFHINNARKARITFTHQVKVYGKGVLKNLDVFIAIPENLPQQKILNISILPQNLVIKKDRWQQQIAWLNYKHIQSNETVESIMTVDAEISAIRYFIFPEKVGLLQSIPEEIRKQYTCNGSKYLTNDRYIQQLAIDIVGKETNPYWMARKIFDYVRNNLEYKLEGGWNAAPYVLQRGSGSCSEYTFSFISLCRAAGLPARYAGSMVVRGDDASMDDVYHRWSEVYLPGFGWIPFDPQGGDKPLARDQALNIGNLPNRFLITTLNGGDSEYLGWFYNHFEKYQTSPQVEVNIESFAEWEPLNQ
jgi:sugar lactone lactonase YvrE